MPGRYARAALWVFFAGFVLFLYGPTLTIMILAFQGPDGGLTFPMNGVSLHWFFRLFETPGGRRYRRLVATLGAARGDGDGGDGGDLGRGGIGVPAAIPGAGVLFTLTVASLIVPSILVSLGVGLLFSLAGWDPDWYSSAFGAQSDVDAAVRTADHVRRAATASIGDGRKRRAISAPARSRCSVMWCCRSSRRAWWAIALFGFTLSYDEFARTLLTAGSDNTLPLEIFGMTTNITTPVLYALGTLTTYLSAVVIGIALVSVITLRRRRERHGSDAGKAA